MFNKAGISFSFGNFFEQKCPFCFLKRNVIISLPIGRQDMCILNQN